MNTYIEEALMKRIEQEEKEKERILALAVDLLLKGECKLPVSCENLPVPRNCKDCVRKYLLEN